MLRCGSDILDHSEWLNGQYQRLQKFYMPQNSILRLSVEMKIAPFPRLHSPQSGHIIIHPQKRWNFTYGLSWDHFTLINSHVVDLKIANLLHWLSRIFDIPPLEYFKKIWHTTTGILLVTGLNFCELMFNHKNPENLCLTNFGVLFHAYV